MDMVKVPHRADAVNFQIFHQNIFIQLIRISLMNKEWTLFGISVRFGINVMPKLSEQPYSMFIFCGIICAYKKHVLSSQWVLLTISLKEFKLLENQF